MAGFKRDFDIELEDVETDIDDDFEDYEDDYDDHLPSNKRSTINRPSRKEEPSDGKEEKFIRNKNDSKDDKTVVFIVIGVVVLVLVVISVFFISSAKQKKQEQLALLQQQEEEKKNSLSISQSEINPGIPNFYGVGEDQNDAYLYDPSLITKDLNGNQLPTDYVVLDSQEVTDYINFKKFRSSTGNGLEFYWLEAEYKGQPYKVQVPYSVYSKLDYSGITVVDMEVLHLEDGSKIVTYMTVREDAKSLLEQR